jgi:dihydroorotase
MPLPKIVALLTTRPAQALGLKAYGTLAPGSAAGVTIFDPDERWIFRAADSKSKS